MAETASRDKTCFGAADSGETGDGGTRAVSAAPVELTPGRDPAITPRCPHCRRTFASWGRAKIHCKRCRAGPHPRGRDKRYAHTSSTPTKSVGAPARSAPHDQRPDKERDGSHRAGEVHDVC